MTLHQAVRGIRTGRSAPTAPERGDPVFREKATTSPAPPSATTSQTVAEPDPSLGHDGDTGHDPPPSPERKRRAPGDASTWRGPDHDRRRQPRRPDDHRTRSNLDHDGDTDRRSATDERHNTRADHQQRVRPRTPRRQPRRRPTIIEPEAGQSTTGIEATTSPAPSVGAGATTTAPTTTAPTTTVVTTTTPATTTAATTTAATDHRRDHHHAADDHHADDHHHHGDDHHGDDHHADDDHHAGRVQAAGKPPVFNDEVNGTTLNTANWSPYSGSAIAGVRSPSAVSLDGNGDLVITAQNENGTTVSGGMSANFNTTYGYYEFRVRTESDPSATTSGVVLLWPQSGNWPTDGEIDMYETGVATAATRLRTSSTTPRPTFSTTTSTTSMRRSGTRSASTGSPAT